jgi:hypothetical protein
MAYSIQQTVKNSNGQLALRAIKNKELRITSGDLEKLLDHLMHLQDDRCALTGIRFHRHGEGSDGNLLPSADRIDSDGHYEPGNIQIVCRFINFWKGDMDNEAFRRLLALIREPTGYLPTTNPAC